MGFACDAAALVLGLGITLAGAQFFTNAVEWVGRKLRLNEGAVGSVLAAAGTAMPEAMVPVVALLSGDPEHAEAVGLGAILGAPLMLATLAFFVTGLAVVVHARLGRREASVQASPAVLTRDLGFFIVVYLIVLLAGILDLAKAARLAFAGLLVLLYGLYLRRTFACARSGHAELVPAPLFLARRGESGAEPSAALAVAQAVLALGVIILGVRVFVGRITSIAVTLGVSTFVLAVIITPVATELPEKLNSIIWVGSRKDTLALGNITGAMVFQSSVIPALGILLTPWMLGRLEVAAAGLTLAPAVIAYLDVRRNGRLGLPALFSGGLFYLLFLAAAAVWS